MQPYMIFEAIIFVLPNSKCNILVTSGVVMAVIMFLKAITFIVANISKVRHWFSCYWITMKTGREVGQ